MIPPGNAKRRGRSQFILVASIFIVPLATAILLYFSSGWRPMVNTHGMLIDPPRPLSVAGIALADGRPAPSDVFLGTGPSSTPPKPATSERAELLDELARVRIALDKDAAARAARPAARRAMREASSFRPTMRTCSCSRRQGQAGAAFRAQFPLAVDGGHGIYIVDPHGNLMMSYPAAGSARGLLKDLERLLRLSNIG